MMVRATLILGVAVVASACFRQSEGQWRLLA
jgi:hypothetical protein